MLEYLFNKVAGFRCFPVNIAKFLRTPILKSICERLFLPKYTFTLYQTMVTKSKVKNWKKRLIAAAMYIVYMLSYIENKSL